LYQIEPSFPDFRHESAGTRIASVHNMSQGWQTMGTIRLIGENEVVRSKPRRNQGRGRVVRRLFGCVRSVFGFLFVVAVFVFAFCYRADFQDYVISHVYRWSQAEMKSDTFRQGALNHENEVNRVVP
jgi:hypothetical protein